MSKRRTKTVHYWLTEKPAYVTEDINSWERSDWAVHQIVMIDHPDRYGGMLVVYVREEDNDE